MEQETQTANLDFISNVCTLAPMAKATLSGRDGSIQHLIQQPEELINQRQPSRNLKNSSEPQGDSRFNASLTLSSASNRTNRAKIVSQADHFMKEKHKYNKSINSQASDDILAASDYLETSLQPKNKNATVRKNLMKTMPAFQTKRQSAIRIGDERDQLLISKNHAVARQPLQLKNVLAPKINPKQGSNQPSSLKKPSASLSKRNADKQLVHKGQQNMLKTDKAASPQPAKQSQQSVRDGRVLMTPNVIKVEVVFENQQQKIVDRRSSQHSQRDHRILTLRNSVDGIGSKQMDKQSQPQTRSHFNQQQLRANSTMHGVERNIVTWKPAQSTIMTIQSNDQPTSVVPTEAFVPGTKNTIRLNIDDYDSNMLTPRSAISCQERSDDTGNVIMTEMTDGRSPLRLKSTSTERQRRRLSIEQHQQNQLHESSTKTKKMITVTMGQQKQNHMLKENPLMKQEVKHAFYKNERQNFKPLAKYTYDCFGSMINQEKQKGKKPTVSKFIQKANQDLDQQIRKQNQYLTKIMGGRLQENNAADNRSMSPMAGKSCEQKSKSPILNAQGRNQQLISGQLTDSRFLNNSKTPRKMLGKKETLTSVSKTNNEPSLDQSLMESTLAHQMTSTFNEEQQLTSKLVQELYEKMQWQKSGSLSPSINTSQDRRTIASHNRNKSVVQTHQNQFSKVSGDFAQASQNRAQSIDNQKAVAQRQYADALKLKQELKNHEISSIGGQSYRNKSKDTPTISILEHLGQESSADIDVVPIAQKRKVVPNSTVPFVVRPPNDNSESSVLKAKIVRVGSTTSNDLDKNTLFKMKEFQDMNQKLFETGRIPSQNAPYSLLAQDASAPPGLSNFFVSQTESNQWKFTNQTELNKSSKQKFDTFGNDLVAQKANKDTVVVKSSLRSSRFKLKKEDQIVNQTMSPVIMPKKSKRELDGSTNNKQSEISKSIQSPSIVVKGVNTSKRVLLKEQAKTLPISRVHSALKQTKDKDIRGSNDKAGYTTCQKDKQKSNSIEKEGMCILKSIVSQEKLDGVQGKDGRTSPDVKRNSPMASILHSNESVPSTNLVLKQDSSKTRDKETTIIAVNTSSLQKIAQKDVNVYSTSKNTAKNANDALSTSTLLQGDLSAFSITNKMPPKSPQKGFAFFASNVMQASGTQTIPEQIQTAEIETNEHDDDQQIEQTLSMRLKRLGSVSPPQFDTPDYIREAERDIFHSEIDQNSTLNLQEIKFIYVSDDQTITDCKINIQKVLKEAPKAELTAEEFQLRCLDHFMKAMKRDNKPSINADQLNLYDLHGTPILSILDWMQQPLEVQKAGFSLLVIHKSANVTKSIRCITENKSSCTILPYYKVGLNNNGNMRIDESTQNSSKVWNKKHSVNPSLKQESTKRSSVLKKSVRKGKSNMVVVGTTSTFTAKKYSESKGTNNHQSSNRRKIKIRQDHHLTTSQDSNKLAEDSIYSTEVHQMSARDSNTIAKRQVGESKDELYDPSEFSRTALREQLNQGLWKKQQAKLVGVSDPESQMNLMGRTCQDTILTTRLKTNATTLGSARMQPSMRKKSNFHNYVCQTLITQLDEPKKQLGIEDRLSNPASKVNTVRAQTRQATIQPEQKEDITKAGMKRLLEDYYKKPISMNTMRLSNSALDGASQSNKFSNRGFQNQTQIESHLTARNESLPSVIKFSNFQKQMAPSFLESTVETANRSKGGSRNQDIRMSTLTHPMPKHLQVSVIANANSAMSGYGGKRVGGQTHRDPATDYQEAAQRLSQTWAGDRHSVMTHTPNMTMGQTLVYKRFGTAMTEEVVHQNTKNSTITSRSTQPNKKRFTLPANIDRKLSLSKQTVDNFVPARAIKVPLARTMQVKNDQDFVNMKNLFLANCLKLKDGEEGFSEKVESAMSNKIKANRGTGALLTPLRTREIVK